MAKIKGLTKIRDWWHYRPPQRDGIRPSRIALKTKDQAEAIRKALDLKAKSDLAISKGRLTGEIRRYLKAKEEQRAFTRSTIQSTSSALRQLELELGNPVITSVTTEHIQAWRAKLVADGKPDSSVITYMRRAQGFFSWLADSGRIADSPFRGLKLGKIKRSKSIAYCTKDQRNQLVDSCTDPDLLFVLMAGFYLGLRRREIVEAVPEWFRTPGLCEVSETPHYKPKDKELRHIHYGRKFSAFLEAYGQRSPFMLRPTKRHGQAIYRCDTRKALEGHGEDQGVPWLRHHIMRHTFATLHIQAGTPIPTVADWLGDDIKTTYDHYSAYAPTQAHIDNIE